MQRIPIPGFAVLRLLLLLLSYNLLLPLRSQHTLQQALGDLINDPAMQHGRIGAYFVETHSGTIWAQHQSNEAMPPASTLKVLTTATALDALGESYTYKTELRYTGHIVNGELHGDLIIKGYGDPSLASDDQEGAIPMLQLLDQMTAALRQLGITAVKGSIIGDGRWLSGAPIVSSWSWNDIGNYYGAAAWGLNWHENWYSLRFQQSPRLGTTPRIADIDPPVAGLILRNYIRSAPRTTGDNAYIYGGPHTYDRAIRGTIPVGSRLFTIKGSVPDGPLWAAQLLTSHLQQAGIPVAEAARTADTELPELPGQLLQTWRSPSLARLTARTNTKSVNLYAEVMLRTLGKTLGEAGSTESGLDAQQTYWTEKGVRFDGAFLYDGSGLSGRNALSAAFMGDFLRQLYYHKSTYEILLKGLPRAGHRGILRNKLKGTAAQGRLYAKSGTLGGVRTYAGYALRPDGKVIAFSLMAENYTGSGSQIRRKLEQVMLAAFAD